MTKYTTTTRIFIPAMFLLVTTIAPAVGAELRSTVYRYDYGAVARSVTADNQHVICDECPKGLQPLPYVEPKKISMLPQPVITSPRLLPMVNSKGGESVVSIPDKAKEAEISRHVAHFGFDRASVTEKERKRVEAFLKSLPAGARISIKVGGHASTPGSEKYNLKLSEQRARAISKMIKRMGFHIDKTSSYGERRASGKNRAADQRAEIIVSEQGEAGPL